MSQTIISLSSTSPRSGKDTTAEYLALHYEAIGRPVCVISFAAALKAELIGIWGDKLCKPNHWSTASVHQKDLACESWAIKNLPPCSYKNFLYNEGHDLHEIRTPRWHLQQYGTNYIREHLGAQTYWLDRVTSEFGCWTNDTVFIVTDTRFPNEFERLKSEGALMVQLRPSGFPLSHPANNPAFKDQACENALEAAQFDAYLVNSWGRPWACAMNIVALLES